MENTNEQEIKIGDYVKLKSDPDQIFIIAEIVDEYTLFLQLTKIKTDIL